MKTSAKPIHPQQGGFTLLELVIAISIMAIIAGASVPLATMAINSKKKRATIEELDGLQLAASEYYWDTASLPSSIAAMETDPGVTGWAGPYLQRYSIDPVSGLSQYSVDAWSQPYVLSPSGSVLTINSAALGGVQGDSNDLTVTLDVSLIQRAKTLDILAIVNRAILKYNEVYLTSDPLPASYATVLTKLVSAGCLPSTAPFAVDAWGDAFAADPAGLTPVVRVTSANL